MWLLMWLLTALLMWLLMWLLQDEEFVSQTRRQRRLSANPQAPVIHDEVLLVSPIRPQLSVGSCPGWLRHIGRHRRIGTIVPELSQLCC